VYGRGTRLLYSKYLTFYKASISLAGSGLLCLGAVIFRDLKQKDRGRVPFSLFATLVGSYIIFSLLVGDRSQMFVVLIGLSILYSYLYKPIRFSSRFFVLVIIFLLLNSIIRVYRGGNLERLLQGDLSMMSIKTILISPFLSAESFSAYTSLPFLIINRVPFLFGRSLVAFFTAFMPRIIASFRPATGYSYSLYAEYAGLLSAHRGYTFHHVADWYWNFAGYGVALGGCLIGFLMGKLESRGLKGASLFWIVAFASTVGYVPRMLRDSVEGIKSIFYLYWFLPFMFFVLFERFNRFLNRQRSI
jgi:hypothetical protein